jgi:hypothetical protein
MAVALGFVVWNDLDEFESHCAAGGSVGAAIGPTICR